MEKYCNCSGRHESSRPIREDGGEPWLKNNGLERTGMSVLRVLRALYNVRLTTEGRRREYEDMGRSVGTSGVYRSPFVSTSISSPCFRASVKKNSVFSPWA